MNITIDGREYPLSGVATAPINHLMELHRLTGLEAKDVLSGIENATTRSREIGADAGMSEVLASMFSPDALMALGAIVWLSRRQAGEKLAFEEAVEGLSVLDVLQALGAGAESASKTIQAEPGDAEVVPTLPGSDPATVRPASGLPPVPSLSPGPTSASPSTSD